MQYEQQAPNQSASFFAKKFMPSAPKPTVSVYRMASPPICSAHDEGTASRGSLPFRDTIQTMSLAASEIPFHAQAGAPVRVRIILVRHGKPAIPTSLRTGHHGFRRYIDDYEEAGLDPQSAPPEELLDLVKGLNAVFTSGSPRATDSARTLFPEAEIIADPLFGEAPLAAPRIPLLKMKVPVWAVMARIMWHAGYHPEIEDYRRAKARAVAAAEILQRRAEANQGVAVLVAHGYFNAMIGRVLRKRGLARTGSHRVRFWNAVIYETGSKDVRNGLAERMRRRGLARVK
jgi:broad specificity phosphatase PhoE